MKRLLYTVPALAMVLLSPKMVGILGAVIMLGSLIFVHELGHFLAAKRMGMPVETFSLGFGPRLIGFKWKETDVRLAAFPLGGYVKLSGYNPEEPDAEDPHGFLKQPYRKRMLFYAGGVLANVLTTAVLLYVLGTDQSRATPRPQPSPLLISEVVSGSAAAQAGLQAGDQILTLGELRFPGNASDDARPYIEKHPGQALPFVIEREGHRMELAVTPANQNGLGRIGIVFSPSKILLERGPLRLKDFGRGFLAASLGSYDLAKQVLASYGRLVTFRVSIKEVGGPLAIAKAGSDAAKAGWERYLFLCAFISMNLAVLNALPIPFLDGGHMLILSLERLRRKDFSIRAKEVVLTAGAYFLMGLMAFVILLDLWKLKH